MKKPQSLPCTLILLIGIVADSYIIEESFPEAIMLTYRGVNPR